MAKLTKRQRAINEKVDSSKQYPIEEAVAFRIVYILNSSGAVSNLGGNEPAFVPSKETQDEIL